MALRLGHISVRLVVEWALNILTALFVYCPSLLISVFDECSRTFHRPHWPLHCDSKMTNIKSCCHICEEIILTTESITINTIYSWANSRTKRFLKTFQKTFHSCWSVWHSHWLIKSRKYFYIFGHSIFRTFNFRTFDLRTKIKRVRKFVRLQYREVGMRVGGLRRLWMWCEI